jgi:hypothetical protein
MKQPHSVGCRLGWLFAFNSDFVPMNQRARSTGSRLDVGSGQVCNGQALPCVMEAVSVRFCFTADVLELNLRRIVLCAAVSQQEWPILSDMNSWGSCGGSAMSNIVKVAAHLSED